MGVYPRRVELREPCPVIGGVGRLSPAPAVFDFQEQELAEQGLTDVSGGLVEERLDPWWLLGFPGVLEAVANLVDPPELGIRQALQVRPAPRARRSSEGLVAIPVPSNDLELALDRSRRAVQLGCDLFGGETLEFPERNGAEDRVAQPIEQALAVLRELEAWLRIRFLADQLRQGDAMIGRSC